MVDQFEFYGADEPIGRYVAAFRATNRPDGTWTILAEDYEERPVTFRTVEAAESFVAGLRSKPTLSISEYEYRVCELTIQFVT